MEENLNGRQTLVEDNLQCKTTNDGRQSPMKITFDGRQNLMKMTFDRRQPLPIPFSANISLKYQPSGEGGTRSPPAPPHRLLNLK